MPTPSRVAKRPQEANHEVAHGGRQGFVAGHGHQRNGGETDHL
jgi:hypothetical protein